jgi:hypothetical protein
MPVKAEFPVGVGVPEGVGSVRQWLADDFVVAAKSTANGSRETEWGLATQYSINTEVQPD